jgi:hypothetical protein
LNISLDFSTAYKPILTSFSSGYFTNGKTCRDLGSSLSSGFFGNADLASDIPLSPNNDLGSDFAPNRSATNVLDLSRFGAASPEKKELC